MTFAQFEQQISNLSVAGLDFGRFGFHTLNGNCSRYKYHRALYLQFVKKEQEETPHYEIQVTSSKISKGTCILTPEISPQRDATTQLTLRCFATTTGWYITDSEMSQGLYETLLALKWRLNHPVKESYKKPTLIKHKNVTTVITRRCKHSLSQYDNESA